MIITEISLWFILFTWLSIIQALWSDIQKLICSRLYSFKKCCLLFTERHSQPVQMQLILICNPLLLFSLSHIALRTRALEPFHMMIYIFLCAFAIRWWTKLSRLASIGLNSVPLISLLCNSLEDNSWPFHILSRNITKNVAVQLTEVFLDPKPIVFYADMIRAPPKTKCLRSSAQFEPPQRPNVHWRKHRPTPLGSWTNLFLHIQSFIPLCSSCARKSFL